MNYYAHVIIKSVFFSPANLPLVSLICRPPRKEPKRVEESFFFLPNKANRFICFLQNCNQHGKILGGSTFSHLTLSFTSVCRVFTFIFNGRWWVTEVMTAGCSNFLILNLSLKQNFTQGIWCRRLFCLQGRMSEQRKVQKCLLHYTRKVFFKQMTLLQERPVKWPHLPAELLNA